ncbi:MAG: tRNA pseudouridine(55) synthase TruB [Arenimonas sp.]|nr:tRNA pseudouridine(55) synthase TruB [Arenimonas sp.]
MSKLPRTVFRPLDGMLLLDKPPGMSSNQALQRVRHLFRAEKAGHTGSLDPLATGLLPVCFGEATKIAGHLLGNAKSYETVARLGLTSDTDDADGQVLRERAVPRLDRDQITTALQVFIGRISQRPPIYSALKQGGEPLYAKARRGEPIEVAEREVEVRSIELLEASGAELRLRVTCGSGTYIRSIVRDLGEALGCGAHVSSLRRLWVEPFDAPRMHTLDELTQVRQEQGEQALDGLLLRIEDALVLWPRIALDPQQALALGRGQTVQLDEGPALKDVSVVDASGRILGLGELGNDGILRAKRLFRWAAQG